MWTISGGRHKTDYSGRPAFVSNTKDVFELVKQYRKQVRETIQMLAPSAALFKKRGMSTVEAKDVNRMCKHTWQRAGMTSPFNLTTSRKLITVKERKADPAKSAKKLLHRETIADQFNGVHDDRVKAEDTYQHLRQAFHPTKKAPVPTATVIPEAEDTQSFADSQSMPSSQGSSLVTGSGVLSDVIPPSPKDTHVREVPDGEVFLAKLLKIDIDRIVAGKGTKTDYPKIQISSEVKAKI